jgi:hypothetical protein
LTNRYVFDSKLTQAENTELCRIDPSGNTSCIKVSAISQGSPIQTLAASFSMKRRSGSDGCKLVREGHKRCMCHPRGYRSDRCGGKQGLGSLDNLGGNASLVPKSLMKYRRRQLESCRSASITITPSFSPFYRSEMLGRKLEIDLVEEQDHC